MLRLFKRKERTFIGNSFRNLDEALTVLCRLQDDVSLSETEQAALFIGIQCVTEIMNRMRDGKRVEWDD